MGIEQSKYRELKLPDISSRYNTPRSPEVTGKQYLNRMWKTVRYNRFSGIQELWLTRGNSKAYQTEIGGRWVSQNGLLKDALKNVKILNQKVSQEKSYFIAGDKSFKVSEEIANLIELRNFLSKEGMDPKQLTKLDSQLSRVLIQRHTKNK